ncbi:MAG: FAD binding domain-containing protein [Clostridiales bacterium]|nr:FAD binding domain-containing protein [Clostridiales bacterium]
MITCKNYVKAESLEQAYELNQKKSNLLIGGMLWLKMGQRNVQTVIDLSGLGLDTIEEDEEEFRIGCMATLRQIEQHEGLDSYSCGAVRESVRHIVGVQFRNVATVGGSIFGRFGFSDVLTMFLAMDSYVELYRGGIVPLEEFAGSKRDRDILVRLIVKKTPGSFAYQSMRNTRTDFPTLAVAVSVLNGQAAAVVGARPARAMRISDEKKICENVMTEETAAAFGDYVAEMVSTGSNLRGSGEYRKQLARVLVKRACMELGGKKTC